MSNNNHNNSPQPLYRIVLDLIDEVSIEDLYNLGKMERSPLLYEKEKDTRNVDVLERMDEVSLDEVDNLGKMERSPLLYEKEKDTSNAALDFIKNASEKTVTAFANLGEKLSKISGKHCENKQEKVRLVFETAVKCNGKEIKDPATKKFVDSINIFISKFVEKTQSMAAGVKKPIGAFTSRILDEVRMKTRGKSSEERKNNTMSR